MTFVVSAVSAVFILFDVASDWNLYGAIARDANDFNKAAFLSNLAAEELSFHCNCTTASSTCDAVLNTTQLCNAFAQHVTTTSGCATFTIAPLVARTGNVCQFTWSSSEYKTQVDRLQRVRTVSLIINLVVLPFTVRQ